MQRQYQGYPDPEELQASREAMQQVYLLAGDTANAARVRLLDEIQDRTSNADFQPADFDQLLAMLQEPDLDSNVIVTVFGMLCSAGQRGQIPPTYRGPLRVMALSALTSDEYARRHGGLVLLFVLDSRQDRAAIAALVDDPSGFVSKAARDVLKRWGDAKSPGNA